MSIDLVIQIFGMVYYFDIYQIDQQNQEIKKVRNLLPSEICHLPSPKAVQASG